jgi:hypothetical protein
VTKLASMGMWAPVHEDEWDGVTPLELGTATIDSQAGEVVFRGGALPWKNGMYEVRWHTRWETVGLIRLGVRSAIITMGNTTLWRRRSR